MAGELGCLQPNPALFDLEARKRKPRLAHELGAGSTCLNCGDKCPGFQLHFWRKVCINCRCGKAEHNVVEEHDPGFLFVGKIFDRPLRTKKEELEFCYGDLEDLDDDERRQRPEHVKRNMEKKVKFDWIPPNISKSLAKRYLQHLPQTNLPIAGSEGAQNRQQQLERQFPVHDIEPSKCHDLSENEITSMHDYVTNVKANVAGQGEVYEVLDHDFPPPPSPEFLDQLSSQLSRTAIKPNEGTFFAKPYNGKPLVGSTSSSLNSSRNDSPSPTSVRSSPESPNTVNAGRSPESTSLDNHRTSPMTGKDAVVAGSQRSRCAFCKEVLRAGDVAIRAERAGPGKMWHPQCFKCSTCKDLLVDLLYFYHSGQVYCARDFAVKAKIPRCAACDELIFAVEYTGAEDKVWHLKHFCCWECDRPLAGHKYISVQGQPHCLLCYQSKHGKVCHTCGEYINPEDQRLSLESNHWHARPSCFCCEMCKKSLLGTKMARKYGMILCSSQCCQTAKELIEGPAAVPHSTLV